MIVNISAGEVAQALATYLSTSGKFKEGSAIEFLEMNPDNPKKLFVIDVIPDEFSNGFNFVEKRD